MKKLISTLIVASVVGVSALAQGSSLRYSTNASTDPEDKKTSLLKNIAKSKAEQSFSKLYKQAENVEWFEIENGFQVYYSLEGKKGRGYFDNKGRFQFSVLTYGEKYLPVDVRTQVKSVYFLDYSITNVAEIAHFLEPGKTIYLLHLTNGKVWKKVRVADGEMELVEEYKAG